MTATSRLGIMLAAWSWESLRPFQIDLTIRLSHLLEEEYERFGIKSETLQILILVIDYDVSPYSKPCLEVYMAHVE